MSFVYRVVLFGGPAIALVIAGCKPEPEAEVVPESVPLKVWIVLAAGDTAVAAPIPGAETVCESDNRTPCTEENVPTNCNPGDKCIVKHSGRQNIGCRLSKQEVILFVEELYEHHNILGGLNLQPAVGSIATVIKDVVDPVLSTRRHPNNEFVSFVDSCLAASPSCWTPNHLNIYFVGNVRSISNGHIAAVTLDPRGVSSGERPFIFVNDGGYTLGEGFVSGDQLEPEMPTGFQPSAAATYVILTHEVAHYFITRDSGCYPFLDGEHVPKDYEHLLNLESVPQIGENPGCDLSFRQSETEEVQCRHRTGSWTLPIDTCTPDPCP